MINSEQKPTEEQEVLMLAGALLGKGKKIHAIKLLREHIALHYPQAGNGLRELKNFVDAVSSRLYPPTESSDDYLSEGYKSFRKIY